MDDFLEKYNAAGKLDVWRDENLIFSFHEPKQLNRCKLCNWLIFNQVNVMILKILAYLNSHVLYLPRNLQAINISALESGH